jgi:hypothetical protein
MLYRDLARLRTVEDGVPIRQHHPDELRWDGAPRPEWEAFCEEWGLDRLRAARIAGSTPLTGPRLRAGRAGPGRDGGRRGPPGRRSSGWGGDLEPRAAAERRDDRATALRDEPAAAMSQVDRPPCWMNASNRPFAT